MTHTAEDIGETVLHGEQRPLTAAEIAQIPPERLRAIIAAGLAREAWRKVAQIEADLLRQGRSRHLGVHPDPGEHGP